jgi:hypothetical protein
MNTARNECVQCRLDQTEAVRLKEQLKCEKALSSSDESKLRQLESLVEQKSKEIESLRHELCLERERFARERESKTQLEKVMTVFDRAKKTVIF